MPYYVMVTSYVDRFFCDFGINGKKRPYPILWHQATILKVCQSQVLVTTPHEDVFQKQTNKQKQKNKKCSGRRRRRTTTTNKQKKKKGSGSRGLNEKWK